MIKKNILLILLSCTLFANDVTFVYLSSPLQVAILELEKTLLNHEWSPAFISLCEDIRQGGNAADSESLMRVIDECLTSLALHEGDPLLDHIKLDIEQYEKELLEGDPLDTCESFKSKKYRKLCVGFLTITRGLKVTGQTTLNAAATKATLNPALIVNGDEIINGNLQVNGTVSTTAPVPIANGGTNATSMANVDGVVYYDGTLLNTTAVGTSGQILTSQGPGLPPIFVTGSGGSGITSIDANSGFISGSIVTIQGGNNITTTGSGTTMTVGVSGTTTHAVQIGNSTGSLNSVTVGATNTVLLGNTGADPSFGSVPNAATTATNANTPSTIVARDSSGNFSAGTITAATGLVSSSFGSGIVQSSSSGILSVTATVNHAVQVGNTVGTLSSLAVGTAGQVLLGSTSASPSFVTPTAGSGLSVTANATTLSYGISAPLSIANGGTNATSMTNTDGVVYFDGTELNTTTVGTSGQLLTSNGTGVAPTFQSFTITTDSGSVSGRALNLNATTGSGSSVKFSGSGANITLSMTDSNNNTAVGSGAGNTSMGTVNTAFGESAGPRMNNVMANCIFGQAALQTLTNGSSNIAIGYLAGTNLTSNESGNIYLGSFGTQGENSIFRVGSGSIAAAYIGGISGVGVTGSPVLVSSTGQLGVAVSSRKYKDNINDIAASVASKVLDLRPITFNYKESKLKDETHYGLIAEEVEAIIPDLVIYDENKEPQTVKYHELPVLLLAQIKLLSAEIEKLQAQVAALEAK